eukprot:2765694-Pyramimonas_sp.AAC.1
MAMALPVPVASPGQALGRCALAASPGGRGRERRRLLRGRPRWALERQHLESPKYSQYGHERGGG